MRDAVFFSLNFLKAPACLLSMMGLLFFFLPFRGRESRSCLFVYSYFNYGFVVLFLFFFFFLV